MTVSAINQFCRVCVCVCVCVCVDTVGMNVPLSLQYLPWLNLTGGDMIAKRSKYRREELSGRGDVPNHI